MTQSIKRIAIVGTCGSGKTTLARALSTRLCVPHVELDCFRYQPGWREVPDARFWDRIDAQTRKPSWIVDGNYAIVRNLVFARAQLVLWLDYSFIVMIRRLFWRTIRRLITAEEFGNGNRERLGRLLSSRSIILWAIRTHHRRYRQLELSFSDSRYSHLEVIRLESPADSAAWLGSRGLLTIEERS